MNIPEMRAERDRLNAAIYTAEIKEREDWNQKLSGLEAALETWLRERAIEADDSERKNTVTWDIGHGALSVAFGRDEVNYGRGLQMLSGRTLRLEWLELPAPARMLAIVAALLGVPADNAGTDEHIAQQAMGALGATDA